VIADSMGKSAVGETRHTWILPRLKSGTYSGREDTGITRILRGNSKPLVDINGPSGLVRDSSADEAYVAFLLKTPSDWLR
jgi:hypothetical protein